MFLLFPYNYNFELKIKGTDFTASEESDIDLDVTDIVAWDEDGSAGGNYELNLYIIG